jgi:LEA14-like dessication related protein
MMACQFNFGDLMNRVSVLFYVLMVYLLVALNGCALLYRDLEEPRVQLVSVTPQQIGFGGIKLLCRLRIDNPNDVSIPVKGGEFNLEVEDMQVAHGALIDGFTVEARGSELVDVIVDVDSGRSLALAIQILSAGERELDYALTGYVDVSISVLGRVRINETGSVPLARESAAGVGSTI